MSPLKIIVCGATGRTGSRVAVLADMDPRFRVIARDGHALDAADAVIDFTVPDAAAGFAAACARAKVAFVTGTTGLDDTQRAAVAATAKIVPVFSTPNFSRGVALMAHLAAEAARRLPGYNAAIVETHHKGKIDAPSGTALRLAQAARGDGNAPPISSLRLGGVVGDHELTFAGPDERLTLTHRAESRDVFARGALDAALWAVKQKPGLYDMNDLLGLR